MKYRLAIFDFDGTLASTLDGIVACMTDTLTVFGYRAPSPEEVRGTVGLTLEESVRILTKGRATAAVIQEVVKLYRELHDSKSSPLVNLFEGVSNLLGELTSHGVKSVLVSNKGRNALMQLLERLKIWAFFELSLSAEDVKYNKPAPELYSRHIAPHFADIPKAETIVIGDTEVDIRFAKAAGLASCWARYGYGDVAKCHALRPDHEIENIKQLRKILLIA
jgi:phosphoglycolate phosphatase